jgi:hypothetical protein
MEPRKGKKFVKLVKKLDGKVKKVSYGAEGSEIKPGTKKGDSYCARSLEQMRKFTKAAKDPNSPLRLSRKKWKCKGDKSKR